MLDKVRGERYSPPNVVMVPSDRVLLEVVVMLVSVLLMFKYHFTCSLVPLDVIFTATQVNVRLPPSNVATLSLG